MKNFESFRTETELVRRIEQLRELGIKDSEMHVFSERAFDNANLNYTDINVANNEVTLGDKITAFFTGEDPEEVAFERFNFDESVRYELVSSVRNGNYILIVDRDGYYEDPQFITSRYDYLDEDLKLNKDLSDEDKIRLHEERLRVDKNRVQSGEVNLKKDVVTEHQTIEVPVEREEVTIERRRVDEKTAGDFDSTLNEEGVIRVPIHEEQVTVSKDNVVAEEIVIKKNVVQDTKTVGADVRRETVEVEKNVDNDVEVDKDINLDLNKNNRCDK